MAVVKPGRILYEMEGVTEEVAHRRFTWRRPSSRSLTKIVKRDAQGLSRSDERWPPPKNCGTDRR